MLRLPLLLLVLSLLAAGASAQDGSVVDPGGTLTDLPADASSTTCMDSTCSVVFDEAASTIEATLMVADGVASDIRSTLIASFSVSAPPEMATSTLVGSLVSLNVDADGELAAQGDGSSAAYRIDVQVVDQSSGALVATQKVAEGSVAGTASQTVRVAEPVVLNVPLVRGSSYQVELTLSNSATAAVGGSATSDFSGASASWTGLDVAAGSDPLAPVLRLAAVVNGLQEQVDELEEELAELDDRLRTHTHEYLTGRGTGHNNTEATTTPAEFPRARDDDDAGPPPERDDREEGDPDDDDPEGGDPDDDDPEGGDPDDDEPEEEEDWRRWWWGGSSGNSEGSENGKPWWCR
ncbi:MAG: hypothetical protein R3190_19295 [Thermoanaerobaculia bacterium]|nr:hypothetical protein [Thermoanaerobaculia bacterium]